MRYGADNFTAEWPSKQVQVVRLAPNTYFMHSCYLDIKDFRDLVLLFFYEDLNHRYQDSFKKQL
jgi:hypothetical protein